MNIRKNIVDSYYKACEDKRWSDAENLHENAMLQLEGSAVYVSNENLKESNSILRAENEELKSKLEELELLIEEPKNDTVTTDSLQN